MTSAFALRLPVTLALIASLLGACATTPQPTTEGEANGVETLMNIADATLAGGDFTAAVQLYRRAVALAPENPTPRLAIADAYFRAGALTEARVAYAAVADAAPLEANLGLGRVALASGDPTEAKLRFEDALARAPDNVWAMNGLAVAHDLAGRHAEAQSLYAAALAYDPTNRSIANNQALSLVLAGRPADAIAPLRDLARGPLQLPEARHNLALAYGLSGDDETARQLIQDELDAEAVAENLRFYRAARSLADIAPAGGR